ncbi:hypothetical protein KYB31_05850 [Clostridium felsineum]|nr:hypothetical protein [Clostridium felsineum]MCR3758518.1 hypothetical protein [Clostridium felsineum]URZ00745.1 hypothetical protein CLAUR_007330 [Clostridium felsineum]
MSNPEGQVQELPIEVIEQMESIEAINKCNCSRWRMGEGPFDSKTKLI